MKQILICSIINQNYSKISTNISYVYKVPESILTLVNSWLQLTNLVQNDVMPLLHWVIQFYLGNPHNQPLIFVISLWWTHGCKLHI